MGHRAPRSGIKLTERDAAVVKAMLARGDRQHDVAAWFGVNGGRIAEIATGRSFRSTAAADQAHLPPRGPYPSGRDTVIALRALVVAKQALANAEEVVRRFAHS